jgi:glycosyltransferase involved in cell wall biosynthesis
MTIRKYRTLIVASHPVQYAAPLFRAMAEHPNLDVLVAYLSLSGSEPVKDQGFGVEVSWDIPLLEGYPWVHVPNQSPKPGVGKFWGLINPELWQEIRTGKFEAVVVYAGYAYASFWIAAAAARVNKTAFLFSTDASTWRPRDQKVWKAWLKRFLLPHIFGLANTVIVSSTPGKQMVQSFKIPEQRIALTPSSVDNDWWIRQAAEVDRSKIRTQWDIPESALVVLFCAKFQSWKRPQDVLRAFANANVNDSYLVFAGEGALRAELETEARELDIIEQVKFLGFMNQSQLPSVYRAADLFILPSEYEPFGVVVNEAMLCGCPVVVSDHVGAGYDLVQDGKTGFIYPCGNVEALATVLREVLPDRERLKRISEAASQQMETWSPRENVEALVQGIKKSVQ